MLSYWIWLAIFVFLPMAALFLWKKKLMLRHKKTIALCGISAIIFAVPWDYFAIKDGLWAFPSQEIAGLWFLGLPVEEWLFIFFVGAVLSMFVVAFRGEQHA